MSGAPLRVLHVITRMIVGGAQENTLETVCGLDPRRFRTALLCGPESGPEGSLLDEARRRGASVTIEPALRRELRPLLDVRALLRLARVMRRGAFDLVHTHSSKAGVLGRLAARLARVPGVVHTVHGWPFHERQSPARRRLYVALERAAARAADRLVAVSTRDLETGLAAGIGPRARWVVVRSAVDLGGVRAAAGRRAAVRAAWGVPPEAAVVGTVARLAPQKAPLDFVEAAARIARARPEARFVVAGDGPLRAAVEEGVRAAGLAGRLVLLGLRRDVAEVLAGLDVFVTTALWEGLPRALVQAMAAGLPVVATAAGGTPEVVRPEESGLLVPAGRPEATAGAVLRLLADPALARRLGEAGRSAVGAEFDLPTMLARLAALYEDVVAARRAGRRS
jgi:glycosyltransferase involved in cell wall biosynthesis